MRVRSLIVAACLARAFGALQTLPQVTFSVMVTANNKDSSKPNLRQAITSIAGEGTNPLFTPFGAKRDEWVYGCEIGVDSTRNVLLFSELPDALLATTALRALLP